MDQWETFIPGSLALRIALYTKILLLTRLFYLAKYSCSHYFIYHDLSGNLWQQVLQILNCVERFWEGRACQLTAWSLWFFN